MPYSRSVQITVKSRVAAVTLGVAALAAGGVLLALGLTLIAGLAVVGAVAGGGLMLYRRIAGTAPRADVRQRLDPSLEVFAPRRDDPLGPRLPPR